MNEGLDPRESGSPPITLNELFRILSLGRRRTILYCLVDHPDDAIGFRELVEAVAAREHETDGQRRSWAPQHQRVATALHYEDLPQLAEAGLIEYDRWGGEVRYNRDEHLEDWLARAADSEREHRTLTI
jgi:hypothetical protein